MVQLIHEDDLVDAVALALEPGKRGVFNVVGPTQAPLSRIIDVRGAQAMPVPGVLLKPALARARREEQQQSQSEDRHQDQMTQPSRPLHWLFKC
jgi:nucleoside-diphosphate-sugar epimerase